MPFMAYLALDDPARFSRGDFMRLALVTRPGEPDTLPYSEGTLVDFEKRYCEDRFWDRGGLHFRGDTRIVVTGQTLSFVGRHADPYYFDDCSGLLGQFRHQYKLLFLIAHFHRAALLSMSDEIEGSHEARQRCVQHFELAEIDYILRCSQGQAR